jgi:ring-1,2-phenylacetyl-CoA epoxidase subunit PaaD
MKAATVAPAQAGPCWQWAWLGEVPDPEIPVISIVDLGIVRAVRVAGDGACDVTITPTYSGCPAMQVIADAITEACTRTAWPRCGCTTSCRPPGPPTG